MPADLSEYSLIVDPEYVCTVNQYVYYTIEPPFR